jgi:hypothetical protein
MEAAQIALLPLGKLIALQNEVLELRIQFLTLKVSTLKQLELFNDPPSPRLTSSETVINASDDDDEGFDRAWLEDKAARKVAVKRVR